MDGASHIRIWFDRIANDGYNAYDNGATCIHTGILPNLY